MPGHRQKAIKLSDRCLYILDLSERYFILVMNQDQALIIFVRNPEKGKVKTRLAATVGADAALHIYKKLLQHTFAVSQQTNADRFVFYADVVESDDVWSGQGYHKQLQAAGDLGDKMKAAFAEVFAKGYAKAVIIGSDCPELTSNHLQAAFGKLHTHDVVIGPALDGGYYLLGMKRLHAVLFQNKAWSTGTVFRDTIQTATDHSLLFFALGVLADVDEEKDLPQSWKDELKNLPHLA